MISNIVTIQHAIEVLNSALEADPSGISCLIEARVPCNQALADHPTIQVGGSDMGPRVGVLGLINGIFGADVIGVGPIAVQGDYDETGNFHVERFVQHRYAKDEAAQQ